MTSRKDPADVDHNRHYQVHDVSVAALAALGGLLTLIFVAVLGVSHDLALNLAKWAGRSPSPSTSPAFHPPGPMLELDPERDLATLRRREDAQLHSYGWIDRSAGIVHIPIERAMGLLAEDGK